jgi:hypothetical protein
MTTMRSDISRMDAKLDRAAARADDVMGVQVRVKTDIAAIRATLEDHDSLRERVEALEAQQRG